MTKYFKKQNKRFKLTLRGKEALAGYLFALPALIGFFGFFLPMIIESISFSLHNMEVSSTGYILTEAKNHGFEHYIRALTIDPDFVTELGTAIKDMVVRVPLVIIFSFFAANLINQKFHGRAIARSIFFLPVILTSGIVLGLESSDLLVTGSEEFDADAITNIMDMAKLLGKYTNLPKEVIGFLSEAVNNIYSIVIASGVQILIFLAGLQSISPSLYEASNIEGATAWENFWKITFPMISPLILVNSIYTIIDCFTGADNEMMSKIKKVIFSDVQYGFGSAMAWIYFLTIGIIVLVVGVIISKRVFYYDER